MKTRIVGAVLAALSAPATAQPTPPVPHHARGAPIQVSLLRTPSAVAARAAAERPSGELVAVSADSLWLLSESGLLSLPRDHVSGVRIDRGGKYGVGYAVRRAAGFGLITGVVLTVACASVDDAGGQCILVAPFSVGASALAGLIAGAFFNSERQLTISQPSVEALRPWSRFPQGLPAAFPRGATAGQ